VAWNSFLRRHITECLYGIFFQFVFILFSPTVILSAPFFIDPDLLINPDWSVLSNILPEYTIDFEDVASGTEIYNQYADQGVLFSSVPLAVIPSVQTVSGSKVITNRHPGEEFPGAIEVEFTTGQSEVSAYIGTDEDTNGHNLLVYVNAYDQNGQLVQSIAPANIGPGPCDVSHFVYVASNEKNIWKVEFKVGPGYGFYLDDLGFSDIGPVPASTSRSPVVRIKKPTEAHRFYFDSFVDPGGNCGVFGGDIISENRLKSVTLVLQSGNNIKTFDIGFGRIDETRYSFGGFSNICSFLSEGENLVTVRAEDWEGNTGTDFINLGYYPIKTRSLLLIMTPADFREALVPLMNHKKASGMDANIITIEAISQDSRFSPSRDLPEKIKKAIAYAHEHYQTKYVMLVGDSDKFPVRYCRHVPGQRHAGYGEFYMPADLYYADLYRYENGQRVFDNWDENGNGYMGEMTCEGSSCDQYLLDQVDSIPDVAVGRIPVSKVEDLRTYVAKIIKYENNYHPGWFFNVLLVTGGYPGDTTTNDWIADNTLSAFNKTRHYSNSGHPNFVQQLTDYLNQGQGFVSYIGHGGPCEWASYPVCASIPDLHNENMLPVIFAAACYTAQFHTREGQYLSIDGRDPPGQIWPSPAPEPAAIQPPRYDTSSCAEHLLFRSSAGAIAYIGCYTGSQSWALILAKKFFAAYDHLSDISPDPVILGDMWNQALVDYYYDQIKNPVTGECLTERVNASGSLYWIPSTIYHHIRKYMLYGDPSLRLGGSRTPSYIFLPVSYTQLFTWDVSQTGQQGDHAKLSGRVFSPSTLEIYEGSQLLGTFEVNGAFEIVLPSMDEGIHHLTLYIRNQEGKVMDSRELNITMDTTPPVIEVTSYTPFAVSGQVAISGLSENLARVELYEGDRLLASTFAEPQFANEAEEQPFTIQITQPLEKGLHSFTLRAVDQSGNQAVFYRNIVIEVVDDYCCPTMIKWDQLFNGTYHFGGL